MVEISELVSDQNALLIFDHLTVEVHIWKVIRNDASIIETWKLVYANPPALKTWGRCSLDEVEGLTTDEIFGEGTTQHYMPVVAKILDEQSPFSFQDYFPNIAKHFQFTSVPLGEYFITTGSDITEIVEKQARIENENKELERRVQERTEELEKTIASLNCALEESRKLRDEMKLIAIKDPLTDLYNRRYLEEVLEREVNRSNRSKRELSLIFLDIDRFKYINDTYGHGVGDAVLREVAIVIKKSIRMTDIACRYGGDELVILLPDTPLKMAFHKACEIRDSINNLELKEHASGLAAVTLSFGVAECPSNALTSKQLLNKADTAMLAAKEKGKDRVETP